MRVYRRHDVVGRTPGRSQEQQQHKDGEVMMAGCNQGEKTSWSVSNKTQGPGPRRAGAVRKRGYGPRRRAGGGDGKERQGPRDEAAYTRRPQAQSTCLESSSRSSARRPWPCRLPPLLLACLHACVHMEFFLSSAQLNSCTNPAPFCLTIHPRNPPSALITDEPNMQQSVTADSPPRTAPSIEPKNFCEVQSPARVKLGIGVRCCGLHSHVSSSHVIPLRTSEHAHHNPCSNS